jgi:hypothetical protein
MKRSSEARNFEVINVLQYVFEKWVKRCKKYIDKGNVTVPPGSSDSE